MKKAVGCIILAICLALSFTACDKNNDSQISSMQESSPSVLSSSNIESSTPASSQVPVNADIHKEDPALAKNVGELKPWNIVAIPGMLKSLTGFDYSQYAVVSKENKMGIADLSGNILLPVKFDKISLCFEGIAVDDQIYSDDLKTHKDHGGHGLEHPIYCWDTVSKRPFDISVEPHPCDITMDNLKPCPVHKVKVEEVKNDENIKYYCNNFSGLYGFMKNFKLITKLEYDSVHEFSDGLAAVKKDGLWGYINENGKVVIDFQFDDTTGVNIGHNNIVFIWAPPYDFHNGYAAVCKDNKWGYIDKKGNKVVPFIYDNALSVYKNRAWVNDYEKGWSVIDVK